MHLDEILKAACRNLKAKNIPTPDLDARLLLENVLQKDQSFIILHPDYILTESEKSLYTAHIKQRLTREPLAKILQTKEFWSLSFKTTRETLDPRPDSETLIDAVLEAFPDKSQPYKILDLGTGTGCLLLSLLTEYKQASGIGSDRSEKALEVAAYNARALHLDDRAEFLLSNWCESLNGYFDIIISNPPYIPLDHKNTLEPELAFDPKEALYGGGIEGLGDYEILSQHLKKHLAPSGKIVLEFGKGQQDGVKHILSLAGFTPHSWHKDLGKIIRCGVFYDA